MLEAILITSILAALWYAYTMGSRHGRSKVESDSLREMAESVRRGIHARREASRNADRNARGGDDPDGLRERSFRD
jgi:hypothetical protein